MLLTRRVNAFMVFAQPERYRGAFGRSIITGIGVLYNCLEYNDQKNLLHQVVEWVVVNFEGKIRVELKSPFAYLHELNETLQRVRAD